MINIFEKRNDLKGDLDTNSERYVILEIEELDLEREGIIQRFECTYELFILTLKDFLNIRVRPAKFVWRERSSEKSASKQSDR